MTLLATEIRRMPRAEQDRLFHASPAGPIPVGQADGTAIILPGSWLDRVLGALIRTFWWKGKIFRPESGDLKNRLGPIGIPAVRAEVYVGDSWFAGSPAIILDYSKTSFVARLVRDEMREVAPGVYLGVVYLGGRRVAGFMLEFPDEGARRDG